MKHNPEWFTDVDAAALAVAEARIALYARQAEVAAHHRGVRRGPVLDALWAAVNAAWECYDEAKCELVRVAIQDG